MVDKVKAFVKVWEYVSVLPEDVLLIVS
jgi:hypothetical protein